MNQRATALLIAFGILLPMTCRAQEGTPATAPAGIIFEPAVTNQEQVVERETPARGVPNEAMPVAPGPGPVGPVTGASFGEPLAGTSQLGGSPPFARRTSATDGVLRWGKLNLHPHLSYSISYGDGLSQQLGEQSDSWIHQFMPGILINMGERWSLDYTPTLRWYSDERFNDTVDHRVALNGEASFGEWLLSLAQGFSRTTDPLVETGRETEQDTYSTQIGAIRSLNDRLSVDLGLSQNLRFVTGDSESQGLSDRKSWSTMNWLDYKHTGPLSFGLGAGFTYDDVELGSDMTSEQVQGRVQWTPGPKLSLSASAGMDIRQFLDSEASGDVSPIFSLGAGYQVSSTTSLSLSARRTVSPSYFSDTLSESTGMSAGFNQRLLAKLFLNVSGGYSMREYSGTSGSENAATADQKTYSLSASLSAAILKRGNISLFYNKSWNDSDSELYNFDPQTIGAQISYSF